MSTPVNPFCLECMRTDCEHFRPAPAVFRPPYLSPRQIQVLQLLPASNKEIAQVLRTTPGMVKNHFYAILRRLHCKNRTEAALWAREHLKKE